ncbi:MAG: glycosyltransferase [Pseudomonadota bacterium]
MRILYIGNTQGFSNPDKYYFTPEKLMNGFTRIGHMVYAFNDRDYARYSNILRSQKFGKKKLNTHILSICKKFEPEMIVLGHCKNIENETLDEMREICPGVKIIYRNVDPLNSKANVAEINQRVGSTDAIFITTAGDGLKQFSHPKTKISFMPNPVDPAVENVCAFNNPNTDIDFLFLGSALRDQDDHRARTVDYLQSNKGDMNFHIAGVDNANDKVFGAAYYKMLERSKTGLCMNKTEDYYLYASGRMSQYMASGILAFIPKGPNFEDIFDDDCFITTENDEDLLDKIRFYVQNDEERIRIAKNGYEKIRDYFDVEKVCQYIIETTFEQPLSQDYKWPTAVC